MTYNVFSGTLTLLNFNFVQLSACNNHISTNARIVSIHLLQMLCLSICQ